MKLNPVTIEHIERIGGSKAYFLAVKAWIAIVESGCGGSGTLMPFNHDDHVFVAVHKKVIVGLLVLQHLVDMQETFISVGWVNPEHRGQGIYSKLYAAAKSHSRAAGFKCISGAVVPDNVGMNYVVQKLGRKLHSQIWQETL